PIRRIQQERYGVSVPALHQIPRRLKSQYASEITSIKEEFLHRFVPDDVCHMSYGSIDILLNTGRPKDEVARLFSLDDSPTKQNSEMELEMYLLSVDQLLESVMESAQQFGRMSCQIKYFLT
ncbi:hypothetical protein Tco_1277793, partial [Tanacetum coccineum]